jgi:uncharacterized RDD family membrane protein YckC
VIQTCKQCGAAHGAESTNCYVCNALLSADDPNGRFRSGSLVRTEGSSVYSGLQVQPAPVAVARDWRSEVTVRLQEYRKRQRQLREGPTQPELAFGAEAGAELDKAVSNRAVYASIAPGVPPLRRRVQRVERVEIDLQPSLDFSGAASSPGTGRAAADWHVALVLPMASFHERRLAAMLDAALVLFAYGSFLALFAALGGRFEVSKLDVAVLVATLALFYGQYFALFTFFGGATPGMMWRGLRLATFDGGEPQLRDVAWRSLGYLVSAGTLMLGFLWALWDEDHLCWHDRISHTHLTWTADGMSEAVRGDTGAESDASSGSPRQ